jgi:DNA-binding winged helix-turn-helix (wHTH) protein
MLLRFGRNELNPTRFELRRSNRRVQLAARPMELLLLLVNRRGELVTREEIARRFWPGMDVEDLEARINTAIAQVRAALNEDASRPRFIETVFGKGYRFIGVVETVDPREDVTAGKASVEASVEQGVNGSSTPSPSNDLLSGPAGVAPHALVDGSIASPVRGFERPEAAELDFNTPKPASPTAGKTRGAAWRSWPLSLAGLAALVCIAVVVGIGPMGLRRAKTTSAKSREWTSTQITTNDSDNPVSTAAISPNGDWLAYADNTGISVREIHTGRTRLLKAPGFRVTRLAWFSDETQLLLTGFESDAAGETHAGAIGQDMAHSEIWILSTTGGEARLIRKDAEGGVPSPDGRSVAFVVDSGREIRLAGIDGSNERLIVRGNQQEKFEALFWATGGRRISYQLRRPSSGGYVEIESNYMWSYCSRDIQTGQETARVSDLPFDSAEETADGRLFYLRSHPANDGSHNGIWVVATDPSTGRFMESPVRVYPFDFIVSSGISVTAHGNMVVAVKENPQPKVYVGRLNYPGPTLKEVKRLTGDTQSDFPHSFDAKGEAVYFESDRVQPYYHIFRQRIDSPAAEMLTVGDDAEILPSMMPDGKTLIYEGRPEGPPGSQSSGHYQSGVWVPERLIYRANADGSDARLVWKEDGLDEWRCPLVSGTHCVLRRTDGHQMFTFYLLDPVAGKGRELGRSTYMPTIYGDWALSPDGAVAAIPNHDAQSPSIRLVRLDGSGGESEIKVRQASQLWGICWASDSKGFYAEARTKAQHWLEYIRLSGEVHALRETTVNTWGVPSPDGKKLAFVDSTIERNVFAWH